MKKYISTFLVILIITQLILSTACSKLDDVSNNAVESSFQFSMSEEKEEIDDYQGLKAMKLLAEDEKLQLYCNEAALSFAVKDKISQTVYYSSPQDNPDFNGKQSKKYRSLLSLEMLNNGQKIAFDSFANCAEQNMYRISSIKNGFRVELSIGEKKVITIDDLPNVVDKGRFENKILSKAEEGAKKELQKRYTLYSKNDKFISKHEMAAMIKEYPILQTKDVYIIKRGIPDYVAQKLYDIFRSVGYTTEDIQKDNSDNMISIKVTPLLKFDFVMNFILEDGDLIAELDCSKIQPVKGYPISNIKFLEYFGAIGGVANTKDGFLLLNDGSGSVFDLSRTQSAYSLATIQTYGMDYAIKREQKSNNVEQAVLPVFGMSVRNGGFVSLMEQGEEISSVSMNIAGSMPYTSVYSQYQITAVGSVDAGYRNTSEKQFIDIQQKQFFNQKIRIRYMFMQPSETGLPKMAELVRNRYMNSGKIKRTPQQTVPFFLELIGSVDKNSSILKIIPKVKQIPLTTYNQAQIIMDELTAKGVTDIRVRYIGGLKGGLYAKNTATFDYNPVLGSKKEFINLGKNKQVYFDINFLNVANAKGFNTRKYAARALGENIADSNVYEIATGNALDMRKGRLLSPVRVEEFSLRLKRNRLYNSLVNISYNDLGRMLFSDFNKKTGENRAQSRVSIEKVLESLSENKKVMIDTANSYSWKYADIITNLPVDSSRFKGERDCVPFVQMVLHGNVAYTSQPINNTYDYQYIMLRNISFGAAPCFRWIYEDSHSITGSYYHENMSAHYADWLEIAAEYYLRASSALRQVANAKMIDYKKISDKVFETSYDNGKKIVVNYSSNETAYGDLVVKAKDFIII